MRMASIMDQAICGEVHNANLRSVFPTGNPTRPGKNLPLFLNSRILLKKTPIFLDFADMPSLKNYPVSINQRLLNTTVYSYGTKQLLLLFLLGM